MRFLDFKYDYPQAARDASFKLKQHKNGPIDWRLIGSLEVCRIVDEQNFEQIDGALEHLAEVPLGCLLDTNILESGIAKYFMLAQYSIQYLLFCRGFLEETIGDLKEANDTAQKEIAELKQNVHDSNQQILQLHRKVTEIESLHEVIYPCHLCTKNFISNEALNLHLCRKHPLNTSRRATSFTSDLSLISVDGQGSDQALINTIKLELEIKHLKERLALTEQGIKERNLSDQQICKLTSGEQIVRTFHHIAIQSNLADDDKDVDEREQDEHPSEAAADKEPSPDNQIEKESESQVINPSAVELAAAAPSLPEDNILIQQMEHQLNNFEEWKKDQQKQNECFMLTVQEKLQHLTMAMEQQMKDKQYGEEQRPQLSIAPDFEQLLNTKMEEMTTMNVCRLEDIINKLNMDYNQRLEGLQKDLTNYIQISVQNNSMENAAKEAKVRVDPAMIESNDNGEISASGIVKSDYAIKDINQQRNTVVRSTAPTKMKSTSKPHPVSKVQVKQVKAVTTDDMKMENKSQGLTSAEEDEQEGEEEASDDGTIVSEMSSLEDVQHLQESGDVGKNQMSRTFVVGTKDTTKTNKVTHDGFKRSKKDPSLRKGNRRDKSQRPEMTILTRSDIRNMANVRLKPFGLDMKTKSISGMVMKRALGRIQDSRNLMQNNDPQFTSTRNKLKKFVDKLCSNKLPTNAKVLLRETKMTRQRMLVDVNDIASTSSNQSVAESQSSLKNDNDRVRVDKHSDERQLMLTSTPETEREDFLNEDLKARLERILASPMKQPESYSFHTVKTTKAVVHHRGQGDAGMDQQDDHHEDTMMLRPVPLPRKRVMFEQPLAVNRNTTTAASRKGLYNRDQVEGYLGNQSL